MFKYTFKIDGASPGPGTLVVIQGHRNLRNAKARAEATLEEAKADATYNYEWRLGEVEVEAVEVPFIAFFDSGER